MDLDVIFRLVTEQTAVTTMSLAILLAVLTRAARLWMRTENRKFASYNILIALLLFCAFSLSSGVKILTGYNPALDITRVDDIPHLILIISLGPMVVLQVLLPAALWLVAVVAKTANLTSIWRRLPSVENLTLTAIGCCLIYASMTHAWTTLKVIH